jgi:hypothetical protein
VITCHFFDYAVYANKTLVASKALNATQILLPVVRAGVHSCSPVAPHKYVRLFDAGVIADIPVFLR